LSDLGTGANAELSKIRDEVSTVQARTSDMQLRLRTALLSSDLPPAILTNVYELQQTAELARSQYQTLLTRQKELEAQAYLQIADSRVVSPATVPSSASFPDTKLFLAIAGVAALTVGIALAFVLENYVGGFSSEMQLASVLRLPSAIAVPKQRMPPKTASEQYHSVADTIVALPFSIYSESIRHLQVSIDQALRETGANTSSSHIIMVTSATANEGKTTLALSLTRAYALSGRSAVLIDCDLRKPSVHLHTGMHPSPLLLEYLADSEGARDLADIEVNDTRSKAKLILGARSKDVQGSQVITGESFSELIKEVRATNSVVILDTPPAGLIVDALFLAGLADVVVDVTRYGRTSQRDARLTFEALKRARRPNIPIIAALIAVERSKRANRRKYGGYYIEQET
jgi:Mrp family chromosome partitioning ATPase